MRTPEILAPAGSEDALLPALMARCAVRGLVPGGISGMELGMTNFRLQSAFHSLLSPSVSDTMASLFSSMVRKLFLSK